MAQPSIASEQAIKQTEKQIQYMLHVNSNAGMCLVKNYKVFCERGISFIIIANTVLLIRHFVNLDFDVTTLEFVDRTKEVFFVF